MKRLSLLSLLALAGCYATAEPLYLPDGSSGYQISCGNYLGTTADCIEKAGEMCGPNGYQMFDEAGRPKNFDTQNQSVIAALNNSGATKHDKSSDNSQSAMFIKCKSWEMPLHMSPAPAAPSVETTPVPLSPPLVAPSIASPAPASTAAPANNGPIPLR